MWLGHRLSNLRAAWGPPLTPLLHSLRAAASWLPQPSFTAQFWPQPPFLHRHLYSAGRAGERSSVLSMVEPEYLLFWGFPLPRVLPKPSLGCSAVSQNEDSHSLHRAACLTPLPCSCQAFPLTSPHPLTLQL